MNYGKIFRSVTTYEFPSGTEEKMNKFGLIAGGALASLMAVSTAFAASGYSLFGDAEIVSPGNSSPHAVQLRSDSSPGYGGIDFSIPSGTKFSDLSTLATDYKFESDDSCGGGSPRFQVNVQVPSDGEKNIFVYIGPPPSYTLCPSNVWLNTGDLLEGVNPIDTSQLPGGTFYDPYATALTKYGNYVVTGVQLVTDASWAFPDNEQTVFIDNTNIDGTVYTYDQPKDKDECKNGGWQTFNNPSFKNQGQCVSYTNHN